MITSFPEGYRVQDHHREMYPDCEKQVMPIIKFKASTIKRWSPYMDYEDAIQEGRIALLRCLSDFDLNKSGGSLKAYVSRVLDNMYRDMFWRAVAQCRMPRGYIRNGEGEWIETKMPVLSLEDALGAWTNHESEGAYEPEGDLPDPDQVLTNSHLDAEARRFRMKLLNMLSGKDKDVFEAKFNPPTDLIMLCENQGHEIDEDNPEVPNIVVAKYLDISKNKVDHSMYKIRRAFTQLAKDVDFSDLFGDVVETRGWPMIFVSEADMHDKEFVRRILKERGLDPQPVAGSDAEPDHFQTVKDANGETLARYVDRYPWGMVIVVMKGDQTRTIVAEGDRINLGYGFVFGKTAHGANIQEEIGDYVSWYHTVAKKLQQEAKKNGKKQR